MSETTTVDEAREALLALLMIHDKPKVDALIAAVRAECYGERDALAEDEQSAVEALAAAEAKLRTLREALGRIAELRFPVGLSVAVNIAADALAAAPAEPPKWDVLGAHDEMVRLHGESCDCDVCLVIQEKADAALAATPDGGEADVTDPAASKRVTRDCGDCGHDWSSHLEWPGACSECVCQAFLFDARPADPPASGDVEAARLYTAVVQPDTIWWDDLTPEMQDAWLRAADVVLTRREPLDAGLLATAMHNVTDAGHDLGCDDPTITAPLLAAEYARLEAAE